ncbi:sigma-54 dependent transcriptional regulator [Jannaschia sp. W003]|uniref:sigma-54 dependent transcriptional regulator n=1 Tax=Jannaschia sp. W003 TaxID=2867012 RepID=UPI0021A71A4F|nr:sigma-54 dependent transcriptional regulator [Jannaschia sp. W003]UWQ20490.1 sigma-54 dependent transcriptional regulator [Jannaschia sp. W003]
MDGTILVADDDRTIRTVLTQALTRAGCKVHATASLGTLMRWVDEGKGDLVISDVVMPDGNGLETLPQIAQRRPGMPVIVISAQNTITTAIRAAEAEAYDYLPKPFDLPDLMRRAARALGEKRRPAAAAPAAQPAAEAAPAAPAAAPADDLPLVGRTPRMQALYRLVARVMNTDLPLVVTGESGTGKSLVARAVHDFSDRRAQPFTVVSALDFAAPGTAADLLDRARGGTIVVDEVADLDAEAQGRLARLLDAASGEGGPRIVATALHDPVPTLDRPGGLRSDLWYRLAGAVLEIPALRDRVEDIPLLANHFLARAEREGGSLRRFSPAAMDRVRRHPWPGNVRQLENAVRRLVATSPAEEIAPAELDLAVGPAAPPGPQAEAAGDLGESVARHLQRHFALHPGGLPPAGLYGRVLREIEVPLIEIALDATAGNQARAADLLGINRNTLRKKITDLEISVTRRRKLM